MPKKKSKKDRDFQKVKFKVGKKLPRAENVTSTAFRSRAIVIKEQLKETSSDDLRQEILKKSRNPQELLAHLQHYNASFKLNSLNTIKAIMISDPKKLTLYMGSVIDRVSALTADRERDIRAAALECLRSIFNVLNQSTIGAFIQTITAHLRCTMTHLTEEVKLDSLQFLNLLVSKYPQTLQQDFFKLTQNFLDLISTSSRTGKRSLKISPNSKLSTVKWRQQSFSYLEQLLLTRGNGTTEENCLDLVSSQQHMDSDDGDNKETYLSGGNAETKSMFLSTSGLEEMVIRRCDGGAVKEESDDSLLQKFIAEVLPLIRETWVELLGNEGHYEVDTCSTLMSVVNILNQLHQMVIHSDIKNTQPVMNLLRNEVLHFLSNGFPLSLEGHRVKGSRSKLDKQTVNPSTNVSSSTVLNLKICSLASVLGCSSKTTKDHMTHLFRNTDITDLGEHLDVVLHSMEPGELLERFIGGIIEKQQVTQSKIALILNVVDKLISGSSGLLQETGNGLITLALNPELTHELRFAILTTLNRACLTKKYTLSLSQLLPLLSNCINSYQTGDVNAKKALSVKTSAEKKQMTIIFTLLHHVDTVTSELLRPLLESLWEFNVVPQNILDMLLSVLYARAQNGGLTMALYISFLSTLCGGDVKRNADRESLMHLGHLVKSVLQHIHNTFPNPHQVITLMEHFFTKLVSESGMLPFCTCSALLEASAIAKSFSADFVSDVMICCLRHLAVNESAPEAMDEQAEQSSSAGAFLYEEFGKIMLKTVAKSRHDVQEMTYLKLTKGINECSYESRTSYTKMVEFTLTSHWHWDVSHKVTTGLQQALGVEDLEQLIN